MDDGEGLQGLAALGGERGAQAWDQQQAAHDRFAAMAEGRGPSLAQQQLGASTQQAITDQMGLAAAGRGGNLAAQAQQAGAMGAAGQMGGLQQAAALRSQEQLSAMQGQAGLAGQMGAQAQQMELAGHGMGLQHLQGQQQADLALRGQNMQLATGLTQAGVSAVASGAGALSDERVKQDIKPGGLAASQAVGEIEPQSWEYKPGFGPPGERVGPMAQQLERTPAGASLVSNTPHGKVVDTGGLAALATAATADQEQRLKKLESQLGLAGAKR
jgi:hypothetical protein